MNDAEAPSQIKFAKNARYVFSVAEEAEAMVALAFEHEAQRLKVPVEIIIRKVGMALRAYIGQGVAPPDTRIKLGTIHDHGEQIYTAPIEGVTVAFLVDETLFEIWITGAEVKREA